MIRSLAFVLAASLASFACSHAPRPGVVGSGKAATETRTVAAFRAIDAQGAFALEIVAGAASPAVVVSGDDNLVPHFLTEVSGEKLVLRLRDGTYTPKEPLVVRVAATTISRLETRGAIGAEVEGLAGDGFDAEIAGACKLRARGSVARFAVTASGSNEVEALDLAAREVDLELSGTSKAFVHAGEKLDVDARGACRVRYRGKPQVRSSTSGTSTVDPE